MRVVHGDGQRARRSWRGDRERYYDWSQERTQSALGGHRATGRSGWIASSVPVSMI